MSTINFDGHPTGSSAHTEAGKTRAIAAEKAGPATVLTAGESRAASEAAKAKKKLERHTAAIEAIRSAFRTALRAGGTLNMIATASGLSRNSETFCAAIGELIRTGELTQCKVRSPNGQLYDGWMRVYEG